MFMVCCWFSFANVYTFVYRWWWAEGRKIHKLVYIKHGNWLGSISYNQKVQHKNRFSIPVLHKCDDNVSEGVMRLFGRGFLLIEELRVKRRPPTAWKILEMIVLPLTMLNMMNMFLVIPVILKHLPSTWDVQFTVIQIDPRTDSQSLA